MSISASRARDELFPLIEKVNDDHEPVRITSRKGNAYLIAEDDFRGWQETAYLLRSPANARALMESIAELDAGRGQVRDLLDTEDDE
ncbi:type II toxin-antitoxin system Phd/YefM family antitoxin [Streptomyces fradiae]|uniref:type II toxin-antitoxin system Phd/YefM family antitoxin n=1 Tax=Streptomyces fradiae TaxID=1906 RepID=UPI0029432F16|nr:type II toxin-antitoxin system prevent-host-death family antitoxin [Streptomyces fradiae]WOI62906.1 type II toxin-antitoxin system prevent-host-death family antitoxin [Streptomyces fradiae]